MGRTKSSTGFAWLEPHDRARRDATVLFGVALGVLVVYSLGVFVLVVLVVQAASGEHAERLASWDSDTVVAASAVAAGCVAVAAAVTLAAWRRARNHRARDVGTRSPTESEAAVVQRMLTEVTEPYGVGLPRLAIHESAAPNGASWSGPAGGTVCLTTGALRLPAAELGALCRQLVTGLDSPARDRAVDAVDLIRIAERWTQFVWTVGIIGFVVAAATAGRNVAAAVLLGVGFLVLITRPAIGLATRALPGLFARIDELVDLESTRRSADPEALALLLLHLLEDDRQVDTSWRVVQLWFERDAIEPKPSARGSIRGSAGVLLGMPDTGRPLQRVWAISAPETLADRARLAVNLASGDRKLRRRLDRATPD